MYIQQRQRMVRESERERAREEGNTHQQSETKGKVPLVEFSGFEFVT